MRSYNFRRSLFFTLIVLLVVQLACGLGGNAAVSNGNGGGGDSPDFAATEQALQATQNALEVQQQPTATTPPEPTQAPTKAPAQDPTDPPPPPQQEDPQQTTYSSGDLIYFTDFDGPGDWEDGWVHFSIPEIDYTIYKANGFLHLEIPEQYSSVYAIYDDLYFLRDQADVYIEAYFENMGTHNINNISVVCRATDAGWYEFSILSGGLWYIWKFDGSNGNYTLLKDGGIANLDYDAPHTIGASCVGDTLTFYFDGEKLKNGSVTNKDFREGKVGLAVYADDWKDVIVEFDYFGVQAP